MRADNALALVAEAGRFDKLCQALFDAQLPRGNGRFYDRGSPESRSRNGLTDTAFVSGVRTARYANWVLRREALFQAEDPQGTPAAWLNGTPIESGLLFDARAFESELRRA